MSAENETKLAPIVAICNHKGGVAKTTSTVNLASEFGRRGCSVLVIDLDPQSNASTHIGKKDPNLFELNATSLFCDKRTKEDVSKLLELISDDVNRGFENVCYIPSTECLDMRVSERLREYDRPSEELKIRLDLLRDSFDIILIDCPPSLGLLTGNAISSATHFIIPVDTGSDYSRTGLISLMSFISEKKKVTNPGIKYLGALLTRHNETINAHKAIAQSLTDLEGHGMTDSGKILPYYIHTSSKVNEASIERIPVRLSAKNNKVAIDYNDLTEYLMTELSLSKSLI